MEDYPGTRKWWNTVQWARQRLVDSKQIDGSTWGVWRITAEGLARIESCEIAGDGELPSNTDRVEVASSVTKPMVAPELAKSDVNLRELYNDHVEQLRRRLVTELNALSSRGFEKFCGVLLEQLGYEDLQITDRGADGGLDGFGNFRQGVVRIKSAFQAKKWKDSTVGRPAIDQFRGSITGEYDHGVFLTTSRFSKDAQEASIRRGAISILLLDGNAIADLMIEKGLGVRKQPIYLSDLDSEFFDFDVS